MEKNALSISEDVFFGILQSLPINAYKVDYKNKCNYFIHDGYKYELHTHVGRLGCDMGIKNEYYKIKLGGSE